MGNLDPSKSNSRFPIHHWARFYEFGISVFPEDLEVDDSTEQWKSITYKKFLSFQIQLTRLAIENIRSIVKELHIPFLIIEKKNNSNVMLVDINALKKPYKSGIPTIKDLPLWIREQVDFTKFEILFATPEEIAKAVTRKYSKLRHEFPSIKKLKKEVENLNSHQKVLYGLIVNGVGHAFFTGTTHPKTKQIFENLKLIDLLSDLNTMENPDESIDSSRSFKQFRIVHRQVLKLVYEFAEMALQNFPEIFEDKSLRTWTLNKLKEIARVTFD